mmetsp:Transcript_36785/g.106027  ORF Transcript_36785/g.106027 Transcript_36785/m.106027 type:complete len:200 (-) Transcript_36785:94-693(-)
MAHRHMGQRVRRVAQDEQTQQCPQGWRQISRRASKHTEHLSRVSISLLSRSSSLRKSATDSLVPKSLALSVDRKPRRSDTFRRSGDRGGGASVALLSVGAGERAAAAPENWLGASTCRCGAARSNSVIPPGSCMGSSLDRLPRSLGPRATHPRQGCLIRHQVWPSSHWCTSATSTAEPLASTLTGGSRSEMFAGRWKTA